MAKNLIVTIGRQYGSGGREIGRTLAEKLGIGFYDKELLDRAAQESGISQEIFAKVDEQPTNSFLYSLSLGSAAMGTGFMATPDYLTNDKLFALQSETIRRIAAEQSCVIIGRCADYVLRDNPGMVSLFIHADMERRVARLCECTKLTADQVRQEIKRTDRRRSNYYNYFTDRSWGSPDNYDLSINSGKLGSGKTVDAIAHFITLAR